jgi:hypothetical protein
MGRRARETDYGLYLPRSGTRRLHPGAAPSWPRWPPIGAMLDSSAYDAHRIARHARRPDFIYGDAFPHEANMDQLHGVDFRQGLLWCRSGRRGCSIAAPYGRGGARCLRRISRRTGHRDLAGDKQVGTLGSTATASGCLLPDSR